MNDFRVPINTAADRAAAHIGKATALISVLRAAAGSATEEHRETLVYYCAALTDILSELRADVDEIQTAGLRAAMLTPDVSSTLSVLLDGIQELSPASQRIVSKLVYGLLRDKHQPSERLDGQSAPAYTDGEPLDDVHLTSDTAE